MTAILDTDDMDLHSSAPRSVEPGIFAPFRNRIFLAFWTASLVSNFGVLI